MRCRELMKTDVKFLWASTTISEAACLMRDSSVGFLPVCDSGKHVIGTLTDRDMVVRGIAAGVGPYSPVSAIMTNDELVACKPDDDVRVAEDHMARAKVSRILVVDEDFRLQGVISLSDVVRRDRARAGATLEAVASRESRPSFD
ncbi:MAG: CBS domain-containing protein [Deltaproteobacteria bacterium]|nr:CBS domain-containing protein [Deltaproteobacteria bacterium]